MEKECVGCSKREGILTDSHSWRMSSESGIQSPHVRKVKIGNLTGTVLRITVCELRPKSAADAIVAAVGLCLVGMVVTKLSRAGERSTMLEHAGRSAGEL